MDARRRAVNSAGSFRRSDSQAAEKGMQRNLDARSEPCDHAFAVERNDPHLAIRKVFRQKAAIWSEGVVGVWNREVDFVNANFQRVPRLCFFDEYRTVQ